MSCYTKLQQIFPTFGMFGSLCYATTFTASKHKFDPRSRKAIFLGFSPCTKVFFFMTYIAKSYFYLWMLILKSSSLPFMLHQPLPILILIPTLIYSHTILIHSYPLHLIHIYIPSSTFAFTPHSPSDFPPLLHLPPPNSFTLLTFASATNDSTPKFHFFLFFR